MTYFQNISALKIYFELSTLQGPPNVSSHTSSAIANLPDTHPICYDQPGVTRIFFYVQTLIGNRTCWKDNLS